MLIGSPNTVLIVIRGNSGSGKSTVARTVRETYDQRGMALIGQDVVRREILRERDKAGGVNIGLLDVMCRHALNAGYHVILEGILARSHYGEMLQALFRDHRGTSHGYYLDVSLEETLARHRTRPQRTQFSFDDMRRWYLEQDVLPGATETIIDESSTLARTVGLILRNAGLVTGEATRL
ncbi:AAA family ATPase [Nonomuraea sp. NPDC004702]